MNLSKNFTLAELTKSSTALRLGIDNSCGFERLALERLAENILQPVRDKFGAYTVSSGYRGIELNRVIGSKDTSQHIFGEAADFEIVGVNNYHLYAWIEVHLIFDQLILEFYEEGDPSSGWIHCSYVEGNNRGEAFEL